MNDTTYAAYILERHRAAALARENELMVAHREHGSSVERPHGRGLAAWFRAATQRRAGDVPCDAMTVRRRTGGATI